MKRFVTILLSVVFTSFCLSGCGAELHERLIIRAVGIDFTDSEFQVTVRSAEDSEKEKSFTASSETVAGALEEISKNTGKKPLYSHNSVIVIGRNCAENGMRGAIDFFIRHYDSRPTVQVMLADDSAKAIIDISDEGTFISSEAIAALVQAEKYSGSSVVCDLTALINGTYGANRSAVLPVVRKGDSVELCGAGLVSDMRLRAELDLSALRGYLLINGALNAGECVFRDETCGTVTVSVEKSCAKIMFNGTEHEPRFTVSAEVEGDISSISSEENKIQSSAFPRLEEQLAAVLMENIHSYLEPVVFGIGCDSAGFGTALLRQDAATWKTARTDYAAFLQNAQIDIQVTAKIKRVEEEDNPYL